MNSLGGQTLQCIYARCLFDLASILMSVAYAQQEMIRPPKLDQSQGTALVYIHTRKRADTD